MPRVGRTSTQAASITKAFTPAPSKALPGAEDPGALCDDGIAEITKHGDLVLFIEHGTAPSQAAKFRVSSSALAHSSKYFERLLQPGRFGEGDEVRRKHEVLKEQYTSWDITPVAELPVVTIKELGRISRIKSVSLLCNDLLNIFHGADPTTPLPVANLAKLAIVADRFDALDTLKSYVNRKRIISEIDGKTGLNGNLALNEEKTRQRLLVAVLLDYPLWVKKYSARLITKGWVGKEIDVSAALWWDLPFRLEEELAYRRECALDTIQSLQSYFLGLYTSRERQCKLGYDSSPECDSFQLGEMVRFFMQARTLQLRGVVLDITGPFESYAGDLYTLLDTLRQTPEYQVDKHHTHCGIRTKLVPLLDDLAATLPHIGICHECWCRDRVQHMWLGQKRPLLWKRQQRSAIVQDHGSGHSDLRNLFTATERHWGL